MTDSKSAAVGDKVDWELVSIRPQALHEGVVAQLQQMIIEGTLAPGTRLNERLLCQRLGVSRTPLREAFMMLAEKRLVSLLPNKGASVVELSAQDVADIFEVVSGLEAMAGELACARITADDLREIQALHYEMLAAHSRHDLSSYYRANQSIHDAISRGTRNDVLRDTYLAINARIKPFRFRSNYSRDKWDQAVREHTSIMAALEARDGRRLATILKAHVLAKRDLTLAELAAEESVNAG